MERYVIIWSQCMTLGAVWWMFDTLLKGKGKEWLSFAGALLYMLLPWHVNSVRNDAGWAQILLWMLVPFMITLLLYGEKAASRTGRLLYGVLVAACMGIIGRQDGVAYLILLFLLVIAGICERKWQYPLMGIGGMVLAYPTFAVWKAWLFDGAFAQSGLEYESIMERGYSVGGLFSTFFYRDGNPGMGILLLCSLLFLLYHGYVKGTKLCGRKDYLWLGTAALLTVMSLRYFPWDFVQRLGAWALGLVTLFRTPAVFFGYAQILLCIWSVEKCGVILQAAEKERNERNKGIEVCDVKENKKGLAG